MVHDMIKTVYDGTNITTNIRTIADALQQREMYTKLLSAVNKAVRMYFTFPVTNFCNCREVFFITKNKNIFEKH